MKSYAPFSNTKADFDFHSNHSYWFKQRLMKKLKRNAQNHKINILAKKDKWYSMHFKIISV